MLSPSFSRARALACAASPQTWGRKRTMSVRNLARLLCSAAILAAAAMPFSTRAEEIVVANYGIAANGFPFAVAMGKGFFKEEGADVTGIITSAGGGTTLRNM